MTGKTGKSGGARTGAGRAPVMKLRNKQAVRVAGLWGGERESAWREATINIRRAIPNRVQLDIIDGETTYHLIIAISSQ